MPSRRIGSGGENDGSSKPTKSSGAPAARARAEPSRTARASKRSDAPPPGLILVATPIGNAADIGARALDILAQADVVACEDTRITGKLMAMHGVQARLTPYHEHNAARVRPGLIQRMKNGETVALVSDAGTPLVSDPGFGLVRECIAEEIPVTAVPGASAVLTALQLSGLPTDRFLFAGFLPTKSGGRRRSIEEVAAVPATLVFMESPKRLADSLADMADVLGPRDAAVARELTKLFEEVRRAPLDALARAYAESGPPKGEVTVVVAPPGPAAAADDDEVDRRLAEALATMSVRDAVAEVAAATGRSRREVYARALAVAGNA